MTELQHYFFSCPCYDTIKNSLVNILQAVINVEILTELLLFGCNNLSTDQIDKNVTIVCAFHFFLIKSKHSLDG